MATQTVDTTGHDEQHPAHPSDGLYIRVALILAVVTAIEVGLYYTDFGVDVTNGMLIVLAVVKFVMVAAYFMHLKFDQRVLRRLFLTGLFLAIGVYVAALLTFGVFIEDPEDRPGLGGEGSLGPPPTAARP
jgi:cytochrome c oxidase subunit 4